MGDGSFDKVLYEVSGGVATVTLNDPDKRNMLSGTMLSEVVAAMERARDSEEVRAVVLTGAGDKVFCAGADLGGFSADASLIQKHYASDLFLEFFRLMPRLGKPSLCAANGHVLAGGLGLANKVVPAADFDAAVADWAGRLASKSPLLMKLGHDAMYRQGDMAVDDALEFLRSQLSLAFTTDDLREGVAAFFEKREPKWGGR